MNSSEQLALHAAPVVCKHFRLPPETQIEIMRGAGLGQGVGRTVYRRTVMKTYSKKLTARQNAALDSYESVTGFSPIGLEDFEAGEISARELWQRNYMFIFDLWCTVQNISFPTDD